MFVAVIFKHFGCTTPKLQHIHNCPHVAIWDRDLSTFCSISWRCPCWTAACLASEMWFHRRKVMEKSPSWAWYLFTSDRTRSYSLSWGQRSNRQHLPALPWHDFQNFQCSLSWTSWEKKNENHELRLEGLKFNHFTRGFFWKSWMHQLQRDAGLFAPQIEPSHTFTILPPSFKTGYHKQPPQSHTPHYIYKYKFNKLIQLQYHLSHQAKSLPMSSKQSSKLVTRRSMAVKATSHPLRPSKTVKEAAFSGSSACAKDNRGAPLVSRHCSWKFGGQLR